MEKTRYAPPNNDAVDEELIDTLIAISVVAKRLAEKLRKEKAAHEMKTERRKIVYEQNERAFADTRCPGCLRK